MTHTKFEKTYTIYHSLFLVCWAFGLFYIRTGLFDVLCCWTVRPGQRCNHITKASLLWCDALSYFFFVFGVFFFVHSLCGTLQCFKQLQSCTFELNSSSFHLRNHCKPVFFKISFEAVPVVAHSWKVVKDASTIPDLISIRCFDFC